ncbi:MAG: hypothetical protein ACYTEQ_27505, partial [Planctomycetota bacterium]
MSLLDRAGQPYPGQLSADMSPFSQQALQGAGDYFNSPLASQSNLFQGAAGQLSNMFLTPEGEITPAKQAYYDAFRDNLLRELSDAKDRLGATTSARDKFYSTGRVAGEGKLEEGAFGDLAQTLAQLYMQDEA